MKNSKYCLIDWLGALHDSHKGSIVWLGGEAKGISEILDTAVDELNTMAEQLIRNQVKHGHWIKDSEFDQNDNAHYHCSHCGRGDTHAKQVVVNYCWGCGYRMDEVENDSQRVD